MKKMYPAVIFINGPSSVGKTTVARALQQVLPVPYLYFALDAVLAMMPDKLNQWGITDSHAVAGVAGFTFTKDYDAAGHSVAYLHTGPEGERIITLLHVLGACAVRTYGYIIIDDVAMANDRAAWQQVLREYTIFWVGLTAPVTLLEQRERRRPDRTPGTARGQHSLVHEGMVYDLFIDVSTQSTEQIVDSILTAAF